MTDLQKASKVLNFLQELNVECVINILSPYVTNEQLARIYDDEIGFLIEDEEDGMGKKY